MKRRRKKTTEQPQLENLVSELRTIDCSIERKKLDQVLSFGQDAVPCLEALIAEALEKTACGGATARPRNTDWFVVVHALYLLAHLGAERSLSLVLKFLGQKQEVLDFWLHDLLNEDIWELPYLLGSNQLGELETFVLHKQNNLYCRLAVCTALVQIALNDAAKQNQIRQIFTHVMELEDEDPDFIGLVVSELMDWQDAALKPLILSLLDRGGIWSGIISADDVQRCYERRHPRKLQPLDLHARYDYFGEHAYFSKGTKEAPERIELRKLLKSV